MAFTTVHYRKLHIRAHLRTTRNNSSRAALMFNLGANGKWILERHGHDTAYSRSTYGRSRSRDLDGNNQDTDHHCHT